MLDIMEEFNLVCLNANPECRGLYTWEQETRNIKSVIDYVLANLNMHHYYKYMHIDEEKSKLDISVHNLIEISFNFELKYKNKEI